MENKNKKIIGIVFVVLGVIIISIIIYLTFFKKDASTVIIETPPIQTERLEESDIVPVDNLPQNPQEYDVSQEDEHIFNATDLAKRAKAFAEIFGSYSNQSDYDNFKRAEIFMTKSFSEWVTSYVEQLRENAPSYESYYGISTRSLSTELQSFDDDLGRAEINILTERNESSETEDLEPYLQSILLRFVKVNGEWLVDAAYWEKR